MKKTRVLALVVLLLVGCSAPRDKRAGITENPQIKPPAVPHVPPPPSEIVYPEEDLKFATLQRIKNKIGDGVNASNVRSLGNRADSAIEEESRELVCIAAWANSLPHRQLRKSYLDWVQYYQSELESAKRELASKPEDNSWQRTMESIERARAMKIPTPKECKQ